MSDQPILEFQSQMAALSFVILLTAIIIWVGWGLACICAFGGEFTPRPFPTRKRILFNILMLGPIAWIWALFRYTLGRAIARGYESLSIWLDTP